MRFIKELIEDTREVVEGKAAVATRFSVGLNDPESYDAFALLAELPDLWDLTVPDYSVEMGNSRFIKEAALKDSVLKAKQLTSKPVVSVGRLTSPDTMVQLLQDNVQDLIGAARPSIADPFLPKKISTGKFCAVAFNWSFPLSIAIPQFFSNAKESWLSLPDFCIAILTILFFLY